MYKIELKSLPVFLLSGSVTVGNYRNEFIGREDYIEISVVEEGRILAETDSGSFVIEPHSLIVITSKARVRFSALNGERQKHTTVAVKVRYDISEIPAVKPQFYESQKGENNVFFAPFVKKTNDKSYNSLLLAIRQITARRSTASGTPIDAVAAWFALCSEVSSVAKSDAAFVSLPPSSVLYAERIAKYVGENLYKRITVSEIAESLNVSEGYAQNTFKRVTGKTIVGYINECKIRTAAEIASGRRILLRDVAFGMGFDDPSYFSRLFRKVMGVSYEEYIRKPPFDF